VAANNIEELIKLAHSYEEQGLFSKAIETCNRVLQIDELSFQAIAISCRCYSELDDLEKAITLAGSLIKAFPENPDSHALRAMLHHKEGSQRFEIMSYEKALEISPTHYESLCNLAGAYIESGKFHAAAAKIKRLKDLLPSDNMVTFLEGLLHGAEKRIENEVSSYRDALSKSPDNADMWYNLGGALMDKGDFTEAIGAFRNSIDLDSSKIDVHFNLAAAFFEEKRYSDSESALKRALEDFPENGFLWYNLGYVQASNQKYDLAVQAYKKAVDIDNTMADAYYNMAYIYFKTGDYPKAISTYRRVIELNPERFNAYYHLAFSLDKCKKYDEAIEVYKKILTFRPDDHKSYSKLAMVFHHIGDMEKVKSACIRSLEMEKVSNPEAHYYLGLVAEDEGDFQLASSELRKSLMQEPDFRDAHLRRAVVLRRLKEFDEAKIEAKEAVRSLGSAAAYYEMGRCYGEQNDNRKAAGAYRKAIEIRPSHKKSILALIDVLENDSKSIIRVCEEAIANKAKFFELYYQYALALKADEQYEKALKKARKAVSMKVEDASIYALVASLYSKLGQADKALKYKKKFDSMKALSYSTISD
jgi:tetratricopeptide (TPR) repeat protein